MNRTSWIVVVVVTAVVGAAAFYGGVRYGESQPPTAAEAMEALQNMTPDEAQQAFQSGGGPGANGPGFLFGQGRNGQGRGPGGGFVNGEIVSSDAESVTVKLADGSTKIVFVSDSTAITRSTQGSPGDLSTGQNVVVNGQANSDGSVTAERVQVLPEQAAMPGAPVGGSAPGDSTTTSAP